MVIWSVELNATFKVGEEIGECVALISYLVGPFLVSSYGGSVDGFS